MFFFKVSRNYSDFIHSETRRDKYENLSYKIIRIYCGFYTYIILVSEMRVLFLAVQNPFLPIFHICCIKISLAGRYSRVSGYIFKHLWSRYYESRRSRGNYHAVGLHPRRITGRLEITFSLLSSRPSVQTLRGLSPTRRTLYARCPSTLAQ